MSVKMDCPELHELEALAIGEASDADAPRLQRHLETCDSCQIAFKSIAVQTIAIRTNNAPAPESLRGSSEYPFLRPPLQSEDLGRLGNYRVLRLLGKGGMGLVFHAEDMTLGRAVALKVMRPEQKGDPDGWTRFYNEARTMAKIKHDHLVTIYSAGEEGDVIYFAMELLQGESLDSWSRREARPASGEIIRLGREIAAGLAFIHQNNLIHRDIKPANIWLEGIERRVKILDLGLVRPIITDTSLTASGIVVGTPDYMAPEQARGDAVDARTDLFSLGCVLYGLCTGKKPFEGTTFTAVLMALASKTPTPPHELNARVPRALSDLVMKLLEREPAKRPQSAEVVLKWLRKIDAGQQVQAEEPIKSKKSSKRARHKELSPESAKRGDDIRKPRAHGLGLALVLGLAGVALIAFFIGVGVIGWLALVRKPAADAKKPPPLIVGDKPAGDAKKPPPPPIGDKVFLSDMKEIDRRNWPFKGGKKDGKKDDKKKGPKDDGPPWDGEFNVFVNGKFWPKGIFMHPPHPDFDGDEASLTYKLGGQFKTFEAEVSLGDTPDQAGSASTFLVYGDRKLLWRSNPVWSRADAQKCRIAINGVDQLKLATTCNGEPHGAHAVWIDPVVSK